MKAAAAGPSAATTVGLRIRSVRGQTPLRQIDLARAAGVTREHIARIETLAADPSLAVLIKIADALSVPLTELTHELRLISNA